MNGEPRRPDESARELERLRRRVAELEARDRDPDLADAGEMFRRLVENSLGLMCVHDLDGNLLFVNAAAAQTLGFRPEDGVGWNLRRFLSPSVESEFDAYLARIRAHGVDSGLMRLVAKDGTERVWSYRNVLHEEPGIPPRVLGHAQDVTDRVRAEHALKESERRFRSLTAALVGQWTAEVQASNARAQEEMRERARIEVEGARTRRVYLPAVEDVSAGFGAAGPASDVETVLLVEDETEVRELIRDILESHGYGVVEVGDPRAALAWVERGSAPIHLVLTDVQMLGMSGPVLVDRIAAARPGVKALYVSGHSAEALGRQGVLEAGAAFVEKPFTVTALLGKIREVLGR